MVVTLSAIVCWFAIASFEKINTTAEELSKLVTTVSLIAQNIEVIQEANTTQTQNVNTLQTQMAQFAILQAVQAQQIQYLEDRGSP